jgi:hypothetical protein
MKKVLWFSRHIMSDEQFQDLRRIYGEDLEITNVDGTAANVHVTFEGKINGEAATVPALKELVKDFDVVAAVLPINLKQQLLPFLGEKPLVEALSSRVASGIDIYTSSVLSCVRT